MKETYEETMYIKRDLLDDLRTEKRPVKRRSNIKRDLLRDPLRLQRGQVVDSTRALEAEVQQVINGQKSPDKLPKDPC